MSSHRYKYKGIELSQLRGFCLAATEGNFTVAAQELGLSTSAVWQQVRALERVLGTTLLRRRGRVVEVTPEGQLLLELSQPHVSGLDSLGRLFEERRAELPQKLIVAGTPFLLSHHLPSLVQEFASAHPSVQLHLRACRWYEVLGLVERGEADLGVAPYDREEARRPSLEYEHLWDEPLMLLTSTRHPMARKKKITLRELLRYPFIAQPEDTCTHRVLVRVLQRHNISPKDLRIQVVSYTVDMTFKYVALNFGIALVHMNLKAGVPMPGLQVRVLDPSLECSPIALVARKAAHLPEPIKEFREAVRRFLCQIGSNDD